jgi:hypothetical protein
MLIISCLLGIGLFVLVGIISYRVGYSSGFQDGKYEMDIKISAAMRQIRKELDVK